MRLGKKKSISMQTTSVAAESKTTTTGAASSLSVRLLNQSHPLLLRQTHGNDWKPEIRIPHDSEYVLLNGLNWDTEYEVHVMAENQQGKSEPGVLYFRTPTEPRTVPGKLPPSPQPPSDPVRPHNRRAAEASPPPHSDRRGSSQSRSQ